jgi:hypothetical protein
MYRIQKLLIIGVFILIILFLHFNNDFFFSRAICHEKKEMTNYYFNSIVINKYIDSTQHNYNTLLIKDLTTFKELKIYVVNESSGFYSVVNKGDTIVKAIGSLIVKNKTQKQLDTLKYNCSK